MEWKSKKTLKERPTSNNTTEVRPPQPAVVTEAQASRQDRKKGLCAWFVSHTSAHTEKLSSAVMAYLEEWIDKNEEYTYQYTD
ncbi:hypothetical protein EVAR_38662_1 [Eumeta japonica]|uniref:Uncharacterized protein n=1 Tax=Eumeta variegata TaxID=151549 RepID=A0A4C1Y201_EUMVA|nr:hypothetical protein EVAR_38662_1 [Eumeta japonica]